MTELLEIEEKLHLRREEAADVLRRVADSLSRHNGLELSKGGILVRIRVPDEVELEIEVEIESDGGSLEIELEWKTT